MKIDQHKNKFGNQAQNYTKYRRPYVEDLYRLFFSALPSGSTKILDVACGTGKSTEPLLKEGVEVYGVDIDPLMIEEAKKQAQRKKLDINYSVAEVEHLPFEDEYFDAVTVGTAFHWFANKIALDEIKRVVKKGGILFIFWTLTTKDVPEEDSIPGDFLRSFNWDKVPPELRDLNNISKLLNEHGFRSVSTVRIPFVHTDTVEDQVGLMKTASCYDLLSEAEQKRFDTGLTEILTTKLGKRPYFTYEEEIQVCYGFK